MRIAFTHNLRLTDSEDEAEFDSAETVDAIAAGLVAGGHEIEKIEVTGPASRLAERLESYGPDLIFNTAEGRRGRTHARFSVVGESAVLAEDDRAALSGHRRRRHSRDCRR